MRIVFGVQEMPPLAELLRQDRSEAHLSQEELAERVRISPRTIGDIETGASLRPRAITMSLIGQALELDSERLDAFTPVETKGLTGKAGEVTYIKLTSDRKRPFAARQ